MSLVKRSMERTYVRIRELDYRDIRCPDHPGEEALFLRIDGLGHGDLCCALCVDIDGQLCGKCEDDVHDGEDILGNDLQRITACGSCAAEFAR